MGIAALYFSANIINIMFMTSKCVSEDIYLKIFLLGEMFYVD